MPLELYLGAIVGAAIVYGFWAILKVLAATFDPNPDVIEETETESEYLRAVSRAARREYCRTIRCTCEQADKTKPAL